MEYKLLFSAAKVIVPFILKKFNIKDKKLTAQLSKKISDFDNQYEGSILDTKNFNDFLNQEETKNCIYQIVYDDFKNENSFWLSKLQERAENYYKEYNQKYGRTSLLSYGTTCYTYFETLTNEIIEFLKKTIPIQEKFKIKLTKGSKIYKYNFKNHDNEISDLSNNIETMFSNCFNEIDDGTREVINFCKELSRNSSEHGNGHSISIHINRDESVIFVEDGEKFNLLENNIKKSISGGTQQLKILKDLGYIINYCYDGKNTYEIKKINQGDELIAVDNYCNIFLNQKTSVYGLYHDLPKEYQKLRVTEEEYFSNKLVVPIHCNKLLLTLSKEDVIISSVITLIDICDKILKAKKGIVKQIDISFKGGHRAVNSFRDYIKWNGMTGINILEEIS